jgi:hypothetical protein
MASFALSDHLFQFQLPLKVHTVLAKLNLYFSSASTCFSRPVKLDRRGACRGACIDKFTLIENAAHCDFMMFLGCWRIVFEYLLVREA